MVLCTNERNAVEGCEEGDGPVSRLALLLVCDDSALLVDN